MACKCNLSKIWKVSLSKTILFLGLVDLAVSVAVIIRCTLDYQNTHDNQDLFVLVVIAIGLCTCLEMITGSILKYRWLLLPHLVWSMLRICLIMVVSTGIAVGEGQLLMALVSIIIFSIGLVFSFLYWNIMLSRFVEIRDEQYELPQLVEMQ